MPAESSPKAWMSERDAELYEQLLRGLAGTAARPLRVLEWGSGRSTLFFSKFLDSVSPGSAWVTIEQDRAFFNRNVAPGLAGGRTTTVVNLGPPAVVPTIDVPRPRVAGVTAYVFAGVALRPFVPARVRDRAANLDGYVALPARLGTRFDLVVIDGRMRRRCLLEARHLVGDDGYVILHDASRAHYQCAWSSYCSGRRFGDEWWIGANRPTDFADVLTSPGDER